MKKALLIGINYADIPGDTLHGCIEDIENIAEVLMNQYGYNEQDIVMLRDDIADPSVTPTHANMIQAIKNIVAISSSCTQIWIHYSGHGSLINNGKTGVIVPLDYSKKGFITDTEMMNILKNIACEAMIMMDSCNSGSVCDLQWSYEYMYSTKFVRTQAIPTSISNPNIFMISGCKILQNSAEVFDVADNEYEGAFTDAVIKTLQINNYSVTLGKLMQGVCTWLVNRGIQNQKPMLACTSPTPNWSISPVPSYVAPVTPTSTIQSTFRNLTT